MSFYELRMVIALVALQNYFQQNKVVRNCRIFGMVAIMLLLAAGLLLTGVYASFDQALPLPCPRVLSFGITEYECNSSVLFVISTLAQNLTVYNNGTINVGGSCGAGMPRADASQQPRRALLCLSCISPQQYDRMRLPWSCLYLDRSCHCLEPDKYRSMGRNHWGGLHTRW